MKLVIQCIFYANSPLSLLAELPQIPTKRLLQQSPPDIHNQVNMIQEQKVCLCVGGMGGGGRGGGKCSEHEAWA